MTHDLICRAEQPVREQECRRIRQSGLSTRSIRQKLWPNRLRRLCRGKETGAYVLDQGHFERFAPRREPPWRGKRGGARMPAWAHSQSPAINFRRPYIGPTYLNPVLPVLPGSGAVRRDNFGPCTENRVHHILEQKSEPHQVKN